MSKEPVLVDAGPDNVATLPCCGATNQEHEGRRRKIRWLRSNFKHGVRARVLMTPDHRQCGYIEYVPGEYAWRGVEARGYLFIHCVWIHQKAYQRQGNATRMLEACIEDARREGVYGVAVVARAGPWMAGSALFLKNGFEVADKAPPDYELLVNKFDPAAPDPKFVAAIEHRGPARYQKGLTIIQAAQCPYAVKFGAEIAQAAREDYGLEPRIVELKTCRQAQRGPAPFGVFALIHDGRLLADHPVSVTRFRNLMRKALPNVR